MTAGWLVWLRSASLTAALPRPGVRAPRLIHGRQAVGDGELGQLVTSVREQLGREHDQGIGASLARRVQHDPKLIRALCFDGDHLQPALRCGGFHALEAIHGVGHARVAQDRDPLHSRNRRLEQLQSLAAQLGGPEQDAGDVACLFQH